MDLFDRDRMVVGMESVGSVLRTPNCFTMTGLSDRKRTAASQWQRDSRYSWRNLMRNRRSEEHRGVRLHPTDDRQHHFVTGRYELGFEPL